MMNTTIGNVINIASQLLVDVEKLLAGQPVSVIIPPETIAETFNGVKYNFTSTPVTVTVQKAA